MKHFYVFLLLLSWALAPTQAAAREVSADEARTRAEQFYTNLTRGTRATAASPQLTLVTPRGHRATTDAQPLYAFNVEDNAGFVLVSGDDRARTVLGYATTGSFSYDDIPVQLAAFVTAYERQIESLPADDAETTSPYAASMTATATTNAVEPLLGDICWNQDAPFNNLCPTDRYYQLTTPAGCVAIAAAQIMRYYRYPERGVGERQYSTATQHLQVSADFGNTTYDWANMLANYNNGYTEAQAAAAATLAYHVGVSCKMDYDYEGSGATAKEIAKAFTNYFSYDSNIEYVDRTHYTEPEWEAVLRNEIKAGRPVLQFGEGEGGGHAFVCDGYDGAGFFHYNWGWGGMSNGYYRSSALEPEYLGIGSGMGAYNYMQSALTNIQPPSATSTHVAGLQLAKALTVRSAFTTRNAEQQITASFYNYGLRDFTGEASAVLCNDEGAVVSVLSTKNITALQELEGGTPSTNFAFTIPADVAEGTYSLRLAHRESGAADYTMMKAPVGSPNYLTVTVTANRVTYATPAHAAKLTMAAKPEVLTPLYNSRRASFSVTIHNSGEEFYSYLGVLLQRRNVTGTPVRQYVGVILTRIPKDSTRTFTYSTDSIEVAAGEYDVVAVANLNPDNLNYMEAIGPDELMVTEATINAKPRFPGTFRLTEKLSIAPMDGGTTIRPNSLFKVTASLRNSGGYADGSFALIFFNRQEENIGNSNVANLSINMLQTKQLDIAHSLNVEPGQYGVILASVSGNEATAVEPAAMNGLTFYVSVPTGITDVTAATPRLFVVADGNRLTVEAPAAISSLTVTTLAGRTLYRATPQATAAEVETAGWPAGTYVVNAVTTEGSYATKVLVR